MNGSTNNHEIIEFKKLVKEWLSVDTQLTNIKETN